MKRKMGKSIKTVSPSMEQCENDQAGIKVKAGNKTYLLHNTDKWHKFEKNGLSIFYNYKRFIIRFDANKIVGIKKRSDFHYFHSYMSSSQVLHSGHSSLTKIQN